MFLFPQRVTLSVKKNTSSSPQEKNPVKSVQKIAGLLAIGMLCLFMMCTIKDDNGALVSTGPHTSTGPNNQTTLSKPVILVALDSSYVGIRETLSIAITVMQDSMLLRPYSGAKVFCTSNRGWLSAESLTTDSKGRAILKILDTMKSRMEITFICASTTQSVRVDITDTPDLIQKLLSVMPDRAVLKADGKDNTAIQVMLKNENNNPVSGQCVQFIASTGLIAGTQSGCPGLGQVSTDAQGVARATLTSANVNDTAFITVFLVSDRTKTAQTRVVFKGVTILLTADSTNLKPGSKTAIKAYCVNASNDPIPYAPIFFTLGKDSASNISFVSRDTATGPDGNAQCVIDGTRTGTDSVRVFAAGATASVKINVTDLSLNIALDDKVIQARESKSTILHVTFTGASGSALAARDVKVKRTYKTSGGKDTSDFILGTKTDGQGKCAIIINALPYECTMALEVTAFNTNSDMASAATSLTFITTRTMTINAIPAIIQADGTSKSTITVQVKNEDNNPIVGDQINFITDAGLVTASATTDENGRAVASVTSDRRNTIATVKGTLVLDPSKFVTIRVEFSGVELTAGANPPSINSSGRDSSTISITLVDAAKNPIVGEPINFSKLQDSTHIAMADSVTNNRGEAHCKVYGRGTGLDSIKVEAAGATAKVGISYSSNYLAIDTAAGQTCLANGRDSTQISIIYRQGDKTTPIANASFDVSVTIGSMNRDTVFSKRLSLVPADHGTLSFFMKNPSFANTATIFVFAKTTSELTSATFQLYFKASTIKRIDLSGTPEVISANGSKAKITAVAYDSMGNRVKDQRISFNMASGPGGGEYLDPPTAITAEDGSAITYLVSGKTPSMFKQVWVTAGDLTAIKSDTIKFTIAGPPHAITIRQNILVGHDFNDGTFGLPCAAIVTDVNGNPVADGTPVTFSCKISGWVSHRPVAHFNYSSTTYCYNMIIDTMLEILPFEDLNDNHRCDPGEDVNGDSVASRGEDIDGDGILTIGPPYIDINHNGKRDYRNDTDDVVEPIRYCTWSDSAHKDSIWADFNGNGRHDIIEPLIGWASSMTNSTYTSLLNAYKAAHHGKGYDIDVNQNGIADPQTAVAITRTVQTSGGKAPNEIIYGQADATFVQVLIWAESQGVTTESPAQLILPIIGGAK
jgi:hypothetical protein